MLTDKSVKILKQTKNEHLEKVAKEQEGKLDPVDDIDEDEEFERMSDDDLA